MMQTMETTRRYRQAAGFPHAEPRADELPVGTRETVCLCGQPIERNQDGGWGHPRIGMLRPECLYPHR